MVGGLGKRYSIYYPDGDVEHRTMLGSPKAPGDTLKRRGRTWEVVRVTVIVGEEIDYELHVEAHED